MSRYRGLSLLFWVLLDAGVRAAISITFPFGEPTPGIPGYRTRTLKAVSSPGTKIIGFNLDSSGGTGFGIYSPLNQVNPLGLPSVFNDNPAAIFTAAGADIKQDSHFLVKATDGLAIHGAESGQFLRGAFNFSNTSSLSNTLLLAQLATGDEGGAMVGQFTVETAAGNIILEDVNTTWGPEPLAESSVILGMIGVVVVTRRQF